MTSPRRQLVDPTAPGYFHCVTRCVRRAFLCGFDAETGDSFEHRKTWVEERILELGSIFAVAVYAYAVMSNHVHVVVYVDPNAASGWSDDEVAARWVGLFPIRLPDGSVDALATRNRAEATAGNAERVATCRARLASLSWFMRCLNEPIARRANREDACTGRFWEGRFKCQALLDDAALLACMSYVDLNPVRAKIADDLAASAHTSVQRRIAGSRGDPAAPLLPVSASVPEPRLSLSEVDYLGLVDWTGRQVRPDKRGAIPESTPSVLRRIGVDPAVWRYQVLGIESRYWRAVGATDALVQKAAEMGQCWLKGSGARCMHRAAAAALA
jgi:REP element-mobilizing transposase RayT